MQLAPLFRSLLIFLLAWAMPATASEGERLRVVADDWPPFSGSALPGNGLSLDIIATVLTRAGYEVEVQVIPWARIMHGAQNNEFDVIGSLFHDPRLSGIMTYSDSYYETEIRFVEAAGGSMDYTGLAGLRDYAIVVCDGFIYEDKFDRAQDLNKLVVTTPDQALWMVAHERADITLDSIDVINHILDTEGPDLADRLRIVDTPLAVRSVHMAVRRNHPQNAEIVARFNATLEAMRQDGSLARLQKRHVRN